MAEIEITDTVVLTAFAHGRTTRRSDRDGIPNKYFPRSACKFPFYCIHHRNLEDMIRTVYGNASLSAITICSRDHFAFPLKLAGRDAIENADSKDAELVTEAPQLSGSAVGEQFIGGLSIPSTFRYSCHSAPAFFLTCRRVCMDTPRLPNSFTSPLRVKKHSSKHGCLC